jgi:mRNA interferase MazF
MMYKWNIFFADFNPVIGSEQKGARPVLIISDEDYNMLMPVVTILPITSLKSGRRIYPNEVLINAKQKKETGLAEDSIVLEALRIHLNL